MNIVQAIMKPINTLTHEQVIEACELISKLIESRRFSYDLKMLTNRKKDLDERKEFENND